MTDRICLECSYIGMPARKKRGSGKMEFMAWMLFPLGIPYSLWRMAHKYPACRHCGSARLTALDSPVGEKLARHLNEIPVIHAAPPRPASPAAAVPTPTAKPLPAPVPFPIATPVAESPSPPPPRKPGNPDQW